MNDLSLKEKDTQSQPRKEAEIVKAMPARDRNRSYQPRKPRQVRTRRMNPHLVSLVSPNSLEAEYYRKLRHAVEMMRTGDEGVMISVCSPGAGDGKTMTSINLAGALAQNPDARVLLVELDLRQPYFGIKDYLGLGNTADFGLVNVLNINVSTGKQVLWDRAVYEITGYNLHILPSGHVEKNHYELLGSSRLEEVLREARGCYDYVILDTPPVVYLADSQLIEKWVDGIYLVIAAGRTPRKMVEEALNLVDPDKLLGIIFNGGVANALKPDDDAYAYVHARSAGVGKLGQMTRRLRRSLSSW